MFNSDMDCRISEEAARGVIISHLRVYMETS